eukprot:355000-Chlamydomonas_euryale.AAC.3
MEIAPQPGSLGPEPCGRQVGCAEEWEGGEGGRRKQGGEMMKRWASVRTRSAPCCCGDPPLVCWRKLRRSRPQSPASSCHPPPKTAHATCGPRAPAGARGYAFDIRPAGQARVVRAFCGCWWRGGCIVGDGGGWCVLWVLMQLGGKRRDARMERAHDVAARKAAQGAGRRLPAGVPECRFESRVCKHRASSKLSTTGYLSASLSSAIQPLPPNIDTHHASPPQLLGNLREPYGPKAVR